jgi:hypothetical protein
VQFVSTPDVGVPSSGVTSVGEVARTPEPVPVVAIASSAVAPALTAMIFRPFADSVGSRSKPEPMAVSSARASAEEPGAAVAGHPLGL